MAGKVKTWVWVLLGVIVTCVVGVVAIAGAGFYFFTRHIETRTVSPATASQGVRGGQGAVRRAEAARRARSPRQLRSFESRSSGARERPRP